MLAALRQAARQQLHLNLPEATLYTLERFAQLLLYWNRSVSLTGATTLEEVLLDHVLDSLALAPLLPSGARVADLGSGAGFPGIPTAVVRQDCLFWLVDSRRKRANFLREAKRELGLKHAEIVEARAETLADRFAARFDVVTSRALGKLSVFLDLAEPLLTEGGLAVAFKGPSFTQKAATHPRLHHERDIWYSLPKGQRHCLAVFRKPVSRETLPDSGRT